MPPCFTYISYLSFGTEIAMETVLNFDQQQRARSIYRLHRFCQVRTSEDYRIYDLIKITGDNVTFIGSKYIQESLINMNLRLYISCLNKHSLPDLHNISLRLLQSVNTLNSKLKFKTILIDKSLLLLKALYLEATLTFLKFAAKHCSIAQLLGGSYHTQLCRGKFFHRNRKPYTMSEKRPKINKFANYQNIIVKKQSRLRLPWTAMLLFLFKTVDLWFST